MEYQYAHMPSQTQLTAESRAEFIERFQLEHQTNPIFQTPSQSKNEGRWAYLHNLDKIKQMQLENKRKIQKEKEEENIKSECTFSPKLNKSTATTARNIEGLIKESDDNIYQRQELWSQKKNLRINNIKNIQKKKDEKECNFKPKINNGVSLNKSHISISAEQCLQDPESYSMYINRIRAKREEDEQKRKRQNSLPGSGKIWTAKKKNYNLNYDYTKHEITEKNFPKSKSSKKLNKNSEQFKEEDIKDFKNFNPGSFVNNNKANTYYDQFYKGNNEEFNDEEDFSSNLYILYNRQIEYYKAKEILHDELLDIQLSLLE